MIITTSITVIIVVSITIFVIAISIICIIISLCGIFGETLISASALQFDLIS